MSPGKATNSGHTVRVAAVQAANRTISYKIGGGDEALAAVRANLQALVGLAERAADQGCQIIALPEDCLGTLEWEAGHWDEAPQVLRACEADMLAALGEVAGRTGMHIVCCNDLMGPNPTDSGPTDSGPKDSQDAGAEAVYNTAVLLGPGGELGRYHKVQPTWSERARARGTSFPVFDVPGVGPVGMCICYDIMFPETTRALALGGADIVFHCTLGGASLASAAASRAAFIARAVENYLYLVVAFRGGGSLVIDPRGEILAEGGEPDAILAVDIDPAGNREAGDALGGTTADFRARLFRERNPAAYSILTEPHPPALDRLAHVSLPTVEEAAAKMAEGLTTGADAFYEAEKRAADGRTEEARQRFEELAERFGTIWIGRASRERLAALERDIGRDR